MAVVALTALSIVGQAGSGPALPQEVGELTWRQRFDALEARTPETAEEVFYLRLDYLQLVEELSGLTSRDALDVLYRTTYRLSRPDLTNANTVDDPVAERLDLLELARLTARELGQQDRQALAIQQIGVVLSMEGRELEAIPILEEALVDLPEALRTLPFVALMLAKAYEQVGRYGDAVRTLDGLRARLDLIESDSSNQALELRAMRLRGRILLGLGLHDQAIRVLHRCRDISKRRIEEGRAPSDERWAMALSLLGLANVAQDAERTIREVPVLLAELAGIPNSAALQAQFRILLAEAQSLLERPDHTRERKAVDTFRVALAEPTLPPQTRMIAELLLADMLRRQGAPEELTEAAELLAKCRKDLATRKGTSGEAPLPLESGILATTEARLSLARGDSTEELIQRREELERALEGLLACWADMPVLEGGVGFLQSFRDSVPSQLVTTTLAIDDSQAGLERALGYLFRTQAHASLARLLEAGVPTLEEVRRGLLDDDRGMLLYAYDEDCGHVFAIDRTSIRYAPLPLLESLRTLRVAYRSQLDGAMGGPGELDEGERARERAIAKQISATLLPPIIADRLSEWSGVTVVGSDQIGEIPFEWLPVEDAEYLALRHALDYLPSVPVGMELAKASAVWSAGDMGLDCVVVAGANTSARVLERWPELDELLWTEELSHEMTGAYPGASRILAGAEASVGGLATLSTQGARVLQFFAHGVLDEEAVPPSSLVLSADEDGDGLFHYSDARTSPGAQFVMVTACRSGRGSVRPGDAAVSDLSGAWLSEGTQAVLVSSSDLNYGTTLELSAALHRGLCAGQSPAEALRRARLELLEAGVVATPQELGQLQVIGLGHIPLFEAPAWRWGRGLAAGGLAVLVLGCALAWRRKTASPAP